MEGHSEVKVESVSDPPKNNPESEGHSGVKVNVSDQPTNNQESEGHSGVKVNVSDPPQNNQDDPSNQALESNAEKNTDVPGQDPSTQINEDPVTSNQESEGQTEVKDDIQEHHNIPSQESDITDLSNQGFDGYKDDVAGPPCESKSEICPEVNGSSQELQGHLEVNITDPLLPKQITEEATLKPADEGLEYDKKKPKLWFDTSYHKGLDDISSIEVVTPDHSPQGLVFRGVSVSLGDTQILKDVCGMSEPGKILAIMGPSGAGKTTLMNTLSGRLPLTAGEITLNGKNISRKTKRKICYVLQQDIFFPSLTLRDTLTFTASIRLPDKLSHQQKMSRLDGIIDDLDLRKCLDTPMGGPMMPGLSGGERKRANIACELLTDPSLILLDEPTTGLDSSSAANLMKTMKDYAISHNKVIVCTIHQPSTSLFYSFDSLLLLCSGQTAYYGATSDVVKYFRSIFFPIQPGFNPADFIMDKMKDNDIVQQQIIESCKDLRRSDKFPDILQGKPRDYDIDVDNAESPSMLRRFSDPNLAIRKGRGRFWSNWCSTKAADEMGEENVHASLMDLDETLSVEVTNNSKFATSFFTQYKHLTIRTFKESRPRILDKLKLVENAFICAVFSLIWFQLPRTEDTLRDRMGAIFFIAIHWGFMPFFDATSSFPMEQVVIYKERSSGWYRLSAYYLAKMTSELPLIFAQPLMFLIVSYWVIGLNGPVAFFATIGTVFIDSIAGQSIGLFLGIQCKEMRQAITVSILIQMSIMLLGGLFTRNLPFWLDWLKYLSFLHYSFHCLMILEFQHGPPIQCSGNPNTTIFVDCKQPNITSVPSHFALDYYNVTWEFWQYFLPLIGFILVFRILGYLALRFVNKPQ